MAIIAANTSTPRELTEAGLHIARCYRMVQVGTVNEDFQGKPKIQQKVRIGWEMPLLTKVFDEAKGPQPLVIEKEFTLHMGENANLRKMLTSWRGKPFTEEEASKFDITKLLGAVCMLNITHKASKKDASKLYDEISSVVPVPKGMTCPPQVNPMFVLSYDEWDQAKFDSLPDFIKDKMKTSLEYKELIEKKPATTEQNAEPNSSTTDDDDLPF